MQQPAETAGVPVPPPLIYLGGFALGGVLEIVSSTPSLPTWARIAGAAAGLAGFLALDTTAMLRFRSAGTSPIPFKPSTALVTTGPYRVTRNPMYVGMGFLYAAFALAFSLLWALAFLPLVLIAVDRFVIAREEPYLEARFGQPYRDYKSRVRRWL